MNLNSLLLLLMLLLFLTKLTKEKDCGARALPNRNMFIHDLKNDFYNTLRGKRILVIVNYDIDAICATKILQTLFRYDHMVYSIVPIMGIAGLQRAYNDNKDDVKNVMLINCGVCMDIVDLLQPDEDVTFFICDSHRPMDVCNVYSDSQVRVWLLVCMTYFDLFNC